MHLNVARNDTGGPEIFRSIQGEGRNCGRARTFIRLSGCNLHCVWCDTPYTWNWIGSDFAHVRDKPDAPNKFDPKQEALQLSADEICANVATQRSEGIVITGGEPLMQRVALPELIDALKRDDPGVAIEVETNGSIAPPPALSRRVDLFMVSPKLAHSGNAAPIALKPEVLGQYAALPSAYFKFVARNVGDVAVVSALAAEIGIPPARIYIMPEGTDAITLDIRARDLALPIIDAGFHFSPRLHIHLFGDSRGT
jgi:7-carboxy-7-deazaguanine synthase